MEGSEGELATVFCVGTGMGLFHKLGFGNEGDGGGGDEGRLPYAGDPGRCLGEFEDVELRE